MEQMFNYRSACWVLGLLLVAPLASAQDEEETTNFGREAREGTPALWRDPDKPLDQRERIHHALSRLTFGVTNDTIYEVEQLGLDKWIEQQMEAGAQETDVLQDRLAKIESLTMSNQEIVQTYRVPIPPLRRNATPECECERERE